VLRLLLLLSIIASAGVCSISFDISQYSVHPEKDREPKSLPICHQNVSRSQNIPKNAFVAGGGARPGKAYGAPL